MRRTLGHCLSRTMISVFCGLFPYPATADWELTLEYTEQRAAGSAVNQNDICSGDINDDGDPEIVSLSTTSVDGVRHAELRIARWDGSAYSILNEQLWTVAGRLHAVPARDSLRGLVAANIGPNMPNTGAGRKNCANPSF